MKRNLKSRLWLVAIIDKLAFKVCYYTIDVVTSYHSGIKFSCDDVTGALVTPEFKDIFKKYNIEHNSNIMFELFPFPRFDYEIKNLKCGHWYQFNGDCVRFLYISQNKAGYFCHFCYKYVVNWFDGSKANDFVQLYNKLSDYGISWVNGLVRFYAIPFPEKESLAIMEKML